MAVNVENIRKWVQGLRSDRFKQGKGYLAVKLPGSGWKHCCLGVACELAIEAGVVLQVTELETELSGEVRTFNDNQYSLPPEVQQWLGLVAEDPLLEGDLTATELNDGDGCEPYTFAQIADLVEERFLSDREPGDV